MNKLFKLFFFIFFFFLFANSQIHHSYACTTNCATSATECNISDTTCLGAWNNEVRITIGHALTGTVVDQIIQILTVGKWFCPDGTLNCTAGAIAATDLKDILLAHLDQEWNKALQDVLQQEIYAQAERRGQNVFAGVPPSVSWEKNYPPCTLNSGNCKNVWTAFGNINTDPSLFINRMLQIILSFSGGIIIIILILAGYKLMTSQGDPEKIKEARGRVTSAIIGLLFIVFSFILYTFITHDILHLPGFGA